VNLCSRNLQLKSERSTPHSDRYNPGRQSLCP
jgi:hypothetical protein